jgi:hypothetical protein
MEAIAPLLLKDGITARQISDLAKDVLVRSAAATARMATGRVNQSEVAALTGLTRPEVRRRLQRSHKVPPVDVRALDRSTRVHEGWLRDPLFLDNKGKPRELLLRDSISGFPALVRRHSGDIPPRAVLAVLLSRGLVVVRGDKARVRTRGRTLAAATDAALPEVAPYIADTLKSAASPSSQLKYAHKVKFVVDTPSSEFLLTEAAVTALASAIATLNAPAEAPLQRKSSTSSRQLSISVTMITSPSSEKHNPRTNSE